MEKPVLIALFRDHPDLEDIRQRMVMARDRAVAEMEFVIRRKKQIEERNEKVSGELWAELKAKLREKGLYGSDSEEEGLQIDHDVGALKRCSGETSLGDMLRQLLKQ